MTIQKGGPQRRRQASHLGQGKLERIIKLLFSMPPFAKRLLEYVVIILLTNHTAITDLINLIKAIRQ